MHLMLRACGAVALLIAASCATWGCGLTVTNDPPSYDELQPHERGAVDTIYAELSSLDLQVRSRTRTLFGRTYDLNPIVDKNRINVAFIGLLFTFNFGNGLVHVAAWENLTGAQQALVGSWFGATGLPAEEAYKKFFYRFMALAQGIKQYMYNLYSVKNTYEHKYLFTMELDSTRAAHAYLADNGRKGEVWPFVLAACSTVLQHQQYKNDFGSYFTAAEAAATPLPFPKAKMYMQDHWSELARSEDPGGYLYFLCQAVSHGQSTAKGFSGELQRIHYELDF